MKPPADIPPGVVLARVGKTKGGTLSIRVVGAKLVARGDGLHEFPASWTRALVKATGDHVVSAWEIEPDPTGRETILILDLWVSGAFKTTARLTDMHLAARMWKAMGRQTPTGEKE